MSGNSEQERYQGLQGLRAFAACLVLVQHSVYFSCLAAGTDTMGFRRLQLGATGVFVFFVISGSVMALATTNERANTFALLRLSRIYPAYFLALGIAYVVLSTFGQPPQLTADASLLLFPTGNLNSTFNVPYWTLIYEMQFYALLWLAILCGASHPVRMWLAVGWAAVILGASAAGLNVPVLNPVATQIPFAAANLFFILGYVLASGTMTKDWKPFLALVCLSSVMILYAGAWSASLFALAALCGSAVIGAIRIKTSLVPMWLSKAGDYSYGLYLIHMSLVVVIALSMSGWPLWTVIAATLFGGLLGGVMFGRLEQWFYFRYWRPMAKRGSIRESSLPRGHFSVTPIRPHQR
ncbi:acyltransferase family protein [Mesorhizobium australicum]|uniref:acyltransferase family protein n=1 Tax=Mesorhizobium australicum TaxID=536018 RepID=UPI003337286B